MFETSKARTASLFVTLPTASTTKIMAALVVLEKADGDEEVTVSVDLVYATPAYSTMSASYPATLQASGSY